MKIALEVCVDSARGLAAAIDGGASRVELCAALEVGGLTPSRGMMEFASQAAVPVYVLIRPRAGTFVYDDCDERIMAADIDAVRAAGLAGVVIGASKADGLLDLSILERLAARAEGLGITLHRAFDLVPDPFEALEQAAALGIERILTSGGRPKAAEGVRLIRKLVERAAGRVSIMPGGGITPLTVKSMVEETGVREVHSSCRGPADVADPRAIAFGFQASSCLDTSRQVVRQMRASLDGPSGASDMPPTPDIS